MPRLGAEAIRFGRWVWQSAWMLNLLAVKFPCCRLTEIYFNAQRQPKSHLAR